MHSNCIEGPSRARCRGSTPDEVLHRGETTRGSENRVRETFPRHPFAQRGVQRERLATEGCMSDQPSADPIDAALEALRVALSAGLRPSTEVELAVRAACGASPRTIDRARKQLGVQASRVGTIWMLSLPGAIKDAKDD